MYIEKTHGLLSICFFIDLGLFIAMMLTFKPYKIY